MKRIVLGGIAFFSLACAKPESILPGTWTISHPGEDASRIVSHEAIYETGGKYVGIAKTTTPNGAVMTETETGVWTLEGADQLTVRVDDIQWSFEGADAANTRHWLDQLEPRKSSRISQSNAMFPVTLVWKGNDEFSVTIQGKSVVSRRKKS